MFVFEPELSLTAALPGEILYLCVSVDEFKPRVADRTDKVEQRHRKP